VAVWALLAEGAPGRALQLLTSDCVCDSAYPAVLARLRELHPQADESGLAAPLPEDLPDVTSSWATNQLLAMEAVVRSFPPGSAADPSGLRHQHLLDCLNSAGSASKTTPWRPWSLHSVQAASGTERRRTNARPTSSPCVGLGQPDDLGVKRERRPREGPQAGFDPTPIGIR